VHLLASRHEDGPSSAMLNTRALGRTWTVDSEETEEMFMRHCNPGSMATSDRHDRGDWFFSALSPNFLENLDPGGAHNTLKRMVTPRLPQQFPTGFGEHGMIVPRGVHRAAL